MGSLRRQVTKKAPGWGLLQRVFVSLVLGIIIQCFVPREAPAFSFKIVSAAPTRFVNVVEDCLDKRSFPRKECVLCLLWLWRFRRSEGGMLWNIIIWRGTFLCASVMIQRHTTLAPAVKRRGLFCASRPAIGDV
jgi:hypothetical protein